MLKKSTNDLKVELTNMVSDKFLSDYYGVRSCCSSYDKNEIEEVRLLMFLKDNNFDCSTLTVKDDLLMIPVTDYSVFGSTGGECKVTVQNIYNKYVYKHTQSIASDTWIINHNLNYIPGQPLVTDENDIEISGIVLQQTKTQTIIKFSQPLVGYAYLA